MSLVGVVTLLAIGFLLSNNKKAIIFVPTKEGIMTTQNRIKIEKANELLKSFNPLAININSLLVACQTFTLMPRKKTVRFMQDGIVFERKYKTVTLSNVGVSYVVM